MRNASAACIGEQWVSCPFLRMMDNASILDLTLCPAAMPHTLHHRAQQREEARPIAVILEDGLAPGTARCDVINGAWKLDSQRMGQSGVRMMDGASILDLAPMP